MGDNKDIYPFQCNDRCEFCGEIHSANVECRDSEGEPIDEMFFD
jgi:hypothetical protein